MSGRSQRRPTESLQPHPKTKLVPAMSADTYAAFKADIETRGLLVPLEVTAAGVVLDGRERLRAAVELRIPELEVLIVAPNDELEHILLCALQRKHLSASQRAALAVELDRYRETAASGKARARANLRNGSDVATLPLRGGKTRD
jgi:ParB-like chromosome segregation protein Spo0J